MAGAAAAGVGMDGSAEDGDDGCSSGEEIGELVREEAEDALLDARDIVGDGSIDAGGTEGAAAAPLTAALVAEAAGVPAAAAAVPPPFRFPPPVEDAALPPCDAVDGYGPDENLSLRKAGTMRMISLDGAGAAEEEDWEEAEEPAEDEVAGG
jgi:hypothetical protein